MRAAVGHFIMQSLFVLRMSVSHGYDSVHKQLRPEQQEAPDANRTWLQGKREPVRLPTQWVSLCSANMLRNAAPALALKPCRT